MNKPSKLISILLLFVFLFSAVAFASTEIQIENNWQADIRKLMDEAHIPQATSLLYDHVLEDGIIPNEHAYAIEKVGSDGTTMRMDFRLIATSDYSDEDWSEVEQWLDIVASKAIQGIAADTESMVQTVDTALKAARKKAQPDADGHLPAWASDALLIQEIAVTIPYFPELSNGINGSATQKLQQRLLELGFLNDIADGYFGAKTQAAVKEFEEYVRLLEQDVIDALPTPEQTAAPTSTPASDAGDNTTVDNDAVTPTPPQPTPVTPVDGIADSLLQAYLFSEDYVIARRTLTQDDHGNDVLRLQRRLGNLGCMAATPDGIYGESTTQSVRIFQYYNGLEQTGIADLETQKLLFSSAARRPQYGMLAIGSLGDDVRTLQKRLNILGFTTGAIDGDYGAATANAVKRLQQYLVDTSAQYTEAMASQSEDGGVSSAPAIGINGIADPMLLEKFYADSFPAVPETMKNGYSGVNVVRLQRRLNGLDYYYGSNDGHYGNGTEEAVRSFQTQNGLTISGIADQATLRVLFSESAKKSLKPYVLKISIADQRVYAYGLDSNGNYTNLVRTMKCSTGKDETPTPTGTFQNSTGPGARWHYFKKYTCWAQYAYYIEGDIMFHSVLYNEKNGPVTQSSVNNLGRKASHGCVRLSVEDAKWIYNNCPMNTKIIVY